MFDDKEISIVNALKNNQLILSINPRNGVDSNVADCYCESTLRPLAEDNPGEYDGRINALGWKRKSFEHEKELPAIVTLKQKGKGRLVKYDLEKLINQIHIHPEALPISKKLFNMFVLEIKNQVSINQ